MVLLSKLAPTEGCHRTGDEYRWSSLPRSRTDVVCGRCIWSLLVSMTHYKNVPDAASLQLINGCFGLQTEVCRCYRVCMHACDSVTVWTALVLERSHLLTKTYGLEMKRIYSGIRCCGLANIWISDWTVADQLDVVWLCHDVARYQNEQQCAASDKPALLLMVLLSRSSHSLSV